MIDHVSIPVSDIDRSRAFYRAVLSPLEINLLVDLPRSIGFGRRYPQFWILPRVTMDRVPADTGNHQTAKPSAISTASRSNSAAGAMVPRAFEPTPWAMRSPRSSATRMAIRLKHSGSPNRGSDRVGPARQAGIGSFLYTKHRRHHFGRFQNDVGGRRDWRVWLTAILGMCVKPATSQLRAGRLRIGG